MVSNGSAAFLICSFPLAVSGGSRMSAPESGHIGLGAVRVRSFWLEVLLHPVLEAERLVGTELGTTRLQQFESAAAGPICAVHSHF